MYFNCFDILGFMPNIVFLTLNYNCMAVLNYTIKDISNKISTVKTFLMVQKRAWELWEACN